MKYRNFLVLSVIIIVTVFLFFAWPLPRPLINDPYSTVLLDRNGGLLSVMIARDEQYRFEPTWDLPEYYVTALLTFEDNRFYRHPGIDPRGLVRATAQNIKAGRVVSGGSTLTMQLARLSYKNPPRTLFQKFREGIRALRIEAHYSKQEILSLYAAHAPFGGNIVGMETASWRYFGRPPRELSWAEAATLAVLPNSPSLIRPGKNSAFLKIKRNNLLIRLSEKGHLSKMDLELSLSEPLPSEPLPLENISPHLLTRAVNDGLRGKTLETTINRSLQELTTEKLNQHSKILSGNRIFNAAALILDRRSGEVLAYAGNSDFEPGHGREVDVIPAPRSPGSLLKPFLYALMLSEGSLLPRQLVPDIPSSFGGFMPQNFHRTYFGAVHADEALIRSLNIPFSFLLFEYGQPRFYDQLKNMGMKFLHQPDHYGLSLILGGAENSLWGLTSMFAGLGRLAAGEKGPCFFENSYLKNRGEEEQMLPLQSKSKNVPPITPAAAWQTLESMSLLQRPAGEDDWKTFSSSRKIAWKTGTSWGYRDAWAIGVTPEYVVGVWTGNGDGEGRPGLRGLTAAAPLLFELFNILPEEQEWFPMPEGMTPVNICPESGHIASPDCPEKERIWLPSGAEKGSICPYHKILHLNSEKTHQVTSADYPVSRMVHSSWFVLPPVQAWYYSRTSPSYKSPPPLLTPNEEKTNLAVVYPEPGSTLHLPLDFNKKREKALFEAVCRSGGPVYWHLDGLFIGTTRGQHKIEVSPPPGEHTLTIVDSQGNLEKVLFSVALR